MADRTHELFFALANPSRLAILVHLVDHGEPVSQSELLAIDALRGVHQSTVSGHIKELVRTGLVVKHPGKRGKLEVPMRGTAGLLIASAAAIQAEYFAAGAASAHKLAARMRKADMRRLQTVARQAAR